MDKQHNISNSEWKIMRVLWDNGNNNPMDEFMELKNIIAELQPETEWSISTIRTMLLRLTKKDIVGADKSSGVYKYFPKVSEKECASTETKSFLEKLYNGSVSNFLSCLIEDGAVSSEERREIIDIIESIDMEKKG